MNKQNTLFAILLMIVGFNINAQTIQNESPVDQDCSEIETFFDEISD